MRYKNKVIIAGVMGNLIEAFDMAICGLLSVFLAKYLTSDTDSGLLIILATFFVSFLARPIGAIILGLCSDRYGRKKTLVASIIIMGLSTTLIGLIPSYNVIGKWALLCLLTLRIIQNLSCGAEFLNSSSFLIESSDNVSKGYSGSWASFGAMAGILFASILLLLIIKKLDATNGLEWLLWRLPFVFALVGSLTGLYVRWCIPESREYVLHYASHKQPDFIYLLKQSFHYMISNKIKSICVFVLSSFGVSITCLIYIYPSIQVHIYNQFTIVELLTSNIISLSVMLVVVPFMGKLSDKIDRVHFIRNAAIVLLVVLYPFFYILASGTLTKLILIQALIALPAAAYYAAVPAFLTELFPINLRCTLLSTLYSIAASIAGGVVPLLSLFLIQSTQNPTSPMLIVLLLVSLTLGMLYLCKKKESTQPIATGCL